MNNAAMETWEVSYLRKVIADTGLSGNALAAAAKVSPSTINRPLNDPGYLGRVSPSTLDKVARATGIDYRPFASAGVGEVTHTLTPLLPFRQGNIQLSVDGGTAKLTATVTLDMIPELRRKIDLVEALLKG